MFSGIAAAMPLPLLSLVGWSVVPDFVTKHLLSFLHRSAIIPVPKTQPTYRKQYALTFACVVLGYLSYNLIDSARSMPPNFYQILSVAPTVDEQGLKAAFRQFAKRNHPDRPGVGRDGEELFIMVRDVYEALKNPVVRFAYDRFGPDVLQWSKTCTTTREYIQRGLLQSSGYHVFVGAFLAFWSFVGSSNPVSFWRYLLYATLFVAEISLVLSPSPLPLSTSSPNFTGLLTTYTTHTPLHTLFPQRLVHQHILFLHQLFVFLSFALGRVVPVLISAFSPESSLSPAQTQEMVQQILHLASIADRETSISLHTLLHSIASPDSSTSHPPSLTAPHEHISSFARPRQFVIPPSALSLSDPRMTTTSTSAHHEEVVVEGESHSHPLAQLSREIEELIIEANIKKEDGPLRSVWEAAMHRGREIINRPTNPTGPQNQEQSPGNSWEASIYDFSEDALLDTTPALEGQEKLIPSSPPASPRRNSDGVRASY